MSPRRPDVIPYARALAYHLAAMASFALLGTHLLTLVGLPAIAAAVLCSVEGMATLETAIPARQALHDSAILDLRIYQLGAWLSLALVLAGALQLYARLMFGSSHALMWMARWTTNMQPAKDDGYRRVYHLPRTGHGALSLELVLAALFTSPTPRHARVNVMWWFLPKWRGITSCLHARLAPWRVLALLPLLVLPPFVQFPDAPIDLRAITLLDANATTLPEDAQNTLPRTDAPVHTPEGLHVWPEAYRWGAPTHEMLDGHGRQFVVPWCRLVGWIPNQIVTHPHLCYVDLSEGHMAQNAIAARDYHHELTRSLKLSELAAAPHASCMTAELLAFLDGSHAPRVQFRGLAQHLVMMHSIALHRETHCFVLRTHYVPHDAFVRMDEWSSVMGGVCDYGDVLLEELYREQWSSDSTDLDTFPGALYHQKRFHLPVDASLPTLPEQQHFTFAPVLLHSNLWRMGTVRDETRTYAPVSACRKMHQKARQWLYDSVTAGKIVVG